MQRRLLILGFSSVVLSCATGCTEALIDQSKKDQTKKYSETVSQILFSTDGKKLIFIGPEYHYIFDVQDDFEKLLKSPLHEIMEARFETFAKRGVAAVAVLKDQTLKGGFEIVVENASPAQYSELVALGFKRSTDRTLGYGDREIFMSKRIDLTGTRYKADGFKMPGNVTALNHPYQVDVLEWLSPSKAILLATPVTVAADGVLTVGAIAGGIVLVPLAVMFFAIGGIPVPVYGR
jgi:hypothetical protein